MKRIVILLLIIILAKITCFSQNTYSEIKNDSTVLITSEQLKYTNLIFNEHDKLLVENSLLNKQVDILNQQKSILEETDLLRQEQLSSVENNYQSQIKDLNAELKKKKTKLICWEIGGVTVTASLILLLVLLK